jgi:hypothetical protein
MTETQTPKPKKGAVNPYDVFETDPDAEASAGMRLAIPGGYLQLLRAGGRNEKFDPALAAKITAFREKNPSIDKIPDQEDKRLMCEVYAETIVIGWGSDMFGDGKMPDRDGKPMPFTQKNVVQFFMDLDEIWIRTTRFVNNYENFRRAKLKETIKN